MYFLGHVYHSKFFSYFTNDLLYETGESIVIKCGLFSSVHTDCGYKTKILIGVYRFCLYSA